MVRIRSGGTVAAAAPAASDGDWTRPADWLTLPAVVSGDKKFVGLIAVWPGDSNWVSMNVAGAYTVDWGDGSAAQNVATGVQANHNILWADVDAGTLTTLGYRQAVVTVTMQGAANMTVLNLNMDTASTVDGTSSLWLDIKMASANLTNLTVSGSTAFAGLLQQFEYVGSSAITSAVPAFSTSRALRKIVGTEWTATCTNFSSAFTSCTALTTIPLLDTAAGTNFNNTFSSCTALTTIPLLDTAAGLQFGAMFNGCTALTTIPLLDTAAGTLFNFMFQNCLALTTIPLLNTAAGTDFSSMFNGCSSLTMIPPLVVSSATAGYSSMIQLCRSLRVGALSGTKSTIYYGNCGALSATELDAIYTGLATVVGQTITVTGNWGAAGDTPSIATAKGWTVTG